MKLMLQNKKSYLQELHIGKKNSFLSKNKVDIMNESVYSTIQQMLQYVDDIVYCGCSQTQRLILAMYCLEKHLYIQIS